MKYTPWMVGSGQKGICIKCHLPPSEEGHDGCLGTLPGEIWNACCGHGEDSTAYIQYSDGRTIRGIEALKEQKKQLDFEMEDVYGDTLYCEEYYDEWGDYSLGDIGCSGISIRED